MTFLPYHTNPLLQITIFRIIFHVCDEDSRYVIDSGMYVKILFHQRYIGKYFVIDALTYSCLIY